MRSACWSDIRPPKDRLQSDVLGIQTVRHIDSTYLDTSIKWASVQDVFFWRWGSVQSGMNSVHCCTKGKQQTKQAISGLQHGCNGAESIACLIDKAKGVEEWQGGGKG